MPKYDKNRFARGLAVVLLSGEWSASTMIQRASESFADCGCPLWLPRFCSRVLERYPRPPSLLRLTAFIADELAISRSYSLPSDHPLRQFPDTLAAGSPVMTPHAAFTPSGPLPEIVTAGQLADWLGLRPTELDWLADCHARERNRPSEALRHYRYRWLPKRGGAARLLEVPKRRLREVQRQILREILDRVPPHPAAHGFRRGRSVVTFARPHCGRDVVLRIDLREFFPSIHCRRVHGLFRTIGYPEPVARLLTGLCTNTAPDAVLRPAGDGMAHDTDSTAASIRLYQVPHLPQGAPTSPALANLCAYRLDCRLAGLAAAFGADYTRYADDLAFSGGHRFGRRLARFRQAVLAVALCEGFAIRRRKTVVATRSERQRIAGLVVNTRPNVPRCEYDRLKAILCNCVRHGPASQNRDGHPDFRAHLLGRISYVAMIHPQRGRKLRETFEQIVW